MLPVEWTDAPSAYPNLGRDILALSGRRYTSGLDDCLGTVFFLTGMSGDRIPADTCMHSPETARKALKLIIRENDLVPRKDRLACPGDILVFCTASGGPAHSGIVGLTKNTFWHATPQAGFHMSGWAAPIGQQLLKVYTHGSR